MLSSHLPFYAFLGGGGRYTYLQFYLVVFTFYTDLNLHLLILCYHFKSFMLYLIFIVYFFTAYIYIHFYTFYFLNPTFSIFILIFIIIFIIITIMLLCKNVRMYVSVPLYGCVFDCSRKWALSLWLFRG